MVDPYWTLTTSCEGIWKDKGSSFHARVFRAQQPEDVFDEVAAWTALHRGARHHAWAYRLRVGSALEERSHDAGEPSHSAGTPILHALQSFEVQDCAAVVSRYFGGVKLGVGGLISAYRGAVEDALSRAERECRHPEVEAILELPYELLGRMEADAQDERIRWVDREFSDRVTLRVAIRAASAEYWAKRWTQCYPLNWQWTKGR
jgi:putative IMPACT (imprinted ancient) family translation regulator